MSQKTRINLYLDASIGEAFKRYCRSKKKSYSEIAEGLFYRLLNTPTNNETSSLNAMQNEIHNQAVNAYRRVYESHRKEVIDSAVNSSVSESVEDVSPRIPMPMPIPTSPQGGVKHGISTNHLSKRRRD